MSLKERQLAYLVPLLLVVTASELALNRLAVPALRVPAAGDPEATPPLWHQLLDHAALFLHYFATALAIAIALAYALGYFRDRAAHPTPLRVGLTAACAALAALSAISLAIAPGERLTFWYETSFIVLLLGVALAQFRRGGSAAAKLGVLLLLVPLAIHYYGPLASRTPAGREALWLGLPDRLQLFGQWAVVLVALATPYLYAPRPAARALLHPFPAVVALGVAAGSGLLLAYSYEVGSIVAARGVGFDLGPGAPTSHLALYVVALASITWTAVACLISAARFRRQIGVGLALIVTSGYGLAWPLHYLASAIGILAIAEAARHVKGEENALLARARAAESEEVRGPYRATEPTHAAEADTPPG